ncbi:hypothetical protein ACJRPK_09870 [Aquimarina sp. 2-A2]
MTSTDFLFFLPFVDNRAEAMGELKRRIWDGCCFQTNLKTSGQYLFPLG